MRAARDKMLAERDTRKWCLDRCLATGYCEAVEDLWKLTTQQVVQFCEKCAGEDACESRRRLSAPSPWRPAEPTPAPPALKGCFSVY